MTREEVLTRVREHLAEELEVDVAGIGEGTRFKEDLDADSLDLYELVMELEDTYGISVSEEEATRINTVGDAVDSEGDDEDEELTEDALISMFKDTFDAQEVEENR